ncbi:FGGY family carbohydrate kinase [Raoultibacter timonensis]|uniref:FGGY family carbohydrate kinase n=1 Tax=Raoultibacter timonensis TaxID=1907662 RepID=UPI000C826EE7
MSKKYVVALDQGTTSSRAILFDRAGRLVDMVQHPFEQLYPEPGWVEHNPQDILSSQLAALTELLVSRDVGPAQIDSIGITNQRETTVVWDRETGAPVSNAIVWQCRRTAPIIEKLCSAPEVSSRITAKTGLLPDAYFSASKIKWILDNTPGAREAARAMCSTVTPGSPARASTPRSARRLPAVRCSVDRAVASRRRIPMRFVALRGPIRQADRPFFVRWLRQMRTLC